MSHHLDVSHYQGCVYGAALGDTIGYKNGDWQLNKNTHDILAQCQQLGGILALPLHQWILSDDTIMHMATMDTLISLFERHIIKAGVLFDEVALKREYCDQYVHCLDDMKDREPGAATLKAKRFMVRYKYAPYDERGGSNGAAVRTMAIGLLLPHRWQKKVMIKTAIVASLVTHNNPVAVMGGIVAALFTSYAIQGLPVCLWPWMMLEKDMDIIDMCLDEMQLTQLWKKHQDGTAYFVFMWK